MDDGGLDQNINHHAEVAESQLPREYRTQNDEAHLRPRQVSILYPAMTWAGQRNSWMPIC